jgi:hypothetical protein
LGHSVELQAFYRGLGGTIDKHLDKLPKEFKMIIIPIIIGADVIGEGAAQIRHHYYAVVFLKKVIRDEKHKHKHDKPERFYAYYQTSLGKSPTTAEGSALNVAWQRDEVIKSFKKLFCEDVVLQKFKVELIDAENVQDPLLHGGASDSGMYICSYVEYLLFHYPWHEKRKDPDWPQAVDIGTTLATHHGYLHGAPYKIPAINGVC